MPKMVASNKIEPLVAPQDFPSLCATEREAEDATVVVVWGSQPVQSMFRPR